MQLGPRTSPVAALLTAFTFVAVTAPAVAGEPAQPAAPAPASAATPAAAPKPAATPTPEDPADTLRYVAELRKAYAGRENENAHVAFKNVETLGEMTVGRLLTVMELGFARGLGVGCSHCHVPGKWESEDKPTKKIARGMWTMVKAINDDQLKRIKNLRSERPVVNCTTCHRGEIIPARSLK